MSISKKTESDGLADKPSIIYGYDGQDENEIEIRELVRSGYAQIGPSPGDVLPRSRSQSTPDQELPSGQLPGGGSCGDDCGEDTPAFACDSCGTPTYVERTCYSPKCLRCWAAAVKRRTGRFCGKLEGLRRLMYARSDHNIVFNHIIASLPSFMTDSEDEKRTYERALETIKTLLRENWGIESFAAIYHEYRIKDEYRDDSLDDHGGAKGQGDMRWSDIIPLPDDEKYQYLKREPHFHLFIPTRTGQFDYSVTEAVENQTGWMFHRSEKSGEDNHVSVSDLEDLTRQVMYCFSHSMVNDWNADRHEFTARLKGELHQIYAPDDAEDEIMGYFCKYSKTLLGTKFRHHSGTCDEVVHDHHDTSSSCDDESHPLYDIYGSGQSDTRDLDAKAPPRVDAAGGGGSGGGGSGGGTSEPVPDYARPRCGGSIRPIREVAPKLDDDDWCEQAVYVAALRVAVEEWRDLDEPEVDELRPD